ncbi:hypothetical protein GNX71_00525 [Variovorax sp. RKNM96]|uniref:hypothetical protein n=1 Tax=Variovorax sp. RKNM96 TaxID=2681552 RepID=UPI00197D5809|nr:hypothetical protein [Variovorax sp. RKNM96]QSI28141.1 hypothetical protein GNX71_00525 [Variovorax sp. RKNM96]
MASPESIHHLLTVAARLLDSAASEIRDAKLEPVRDNISQIGHFLAGIFEIQQKVYALRPDLKPAYLSEPSPHSESNKLLTRFMSEACWHEDAGEVALAIDKYREYLLLEGSPHHREIAEGEIRRLSGRDD